MKRDLPSAQRIGSLLMRVRPAPLAVVFKSLLRVQRLEVPTPEGTFWADPASDFGQRLLTVGRYEPELAATLRRLLRPGQVFADVGANEGYFSVLASRLVGSSGRVLAVEPQSRLQPVLRRNFALNHADNVTITAAVVSNDIGVAELNLAPSMNTGATSLIRSTRYGLQRESVPALPLAEILTRAGLTTVDLLKLDIEGWEYEAILGSQDIFRQGRVRAITLELHPQHLEKRGLSITPIMEFLQAAGFRHAPEFETLVFLHRSHSPAPAGS